MKSILSLFSMAALCAVSPLLIANVAHAQQAVVKKSVASTSVNITVPVGGDSATYLFKGKVYTVKPGTSATIPAGATNIKLPTGVMIKAITTRADGSSSEVIVTTNSAVTMASFTLAVVKANASQLTTIGATLVKADGSKIVIDVSADATKAADLLAKVLTDVENNAKTTSFTSKVGGTDGN